MPYYFLQYEKQKNIEEAVKKELGINFGETTKDNRITLEYTNCLGMCDVARYDCK